MLFRSVSYEQDSLSPCITGGTAFFSLSVVSPLSVPGVKNAPETQDLRVKKKSERVIDTGFFREPIAGVCLLRSI